MSALPLLKSVFSLTSATVGLLVNSVRGSFVTAVEHMLGEEENPYEATFGNLSDVASPTGKGICVNGTHFLRSREDSRKNLLVVAATGGGKSSIIAQPNLLTQKCVSFIVHDPSGQLYETCAIYRESTGDMVNVFDLNNPDRSVCINPLDFIDTPSDISKLATHLIRSVMGRQAQDKFWELSAVKLLSLFTSILLEQDVRYRNITNLRHLVNVFLGDPSSIDKLFAKSASDALFSEYKALIKSNDKTLSSIIMTAQAALELWGNENVSRLTSRTTLDIEAFRRGGQCLFIKNATFDAQYNRPLLSLIIENMMGKFMSRLPDPRDPDIIFLLDETATLNLASLDQVVSNNRKYNIIYILMFQNLSQVYNAYGRESGTNIIANCYSKLFLGGTDMKTANELEQLIGTKTICNEEGKQRIVPLMPSQSIRMMKHNEALLICGAHKPFHISVTPYYEQPLMKRRVSKSGFKKHIESIPRNVTLLPL